MTPKTIAQTKKEDKVVVAKVERHGERLVIPEKMDLADAAQVIKRAMEAEEMVVALTEDFNCFVYEGCYALKLALEELYGWVDIQPTPSFFGDEPPQLIGVTINERGDVVQVPWGRFLCPIIPKKDGYLQSYYNNKKGIYYFSLNGQIKQKYSEIFKELCACIRKNLREHSIYKGKALAIKFINETTGKPEPMPKPEFLRLTNIDKDQLILSDRVTRAIEANLFAPIELTEAIRDAGINLKSGVLLAGDYGTGKTMAAFISAKLATDNGHTFIYCKDIREYANVIQFAQLYAEAGKIAVVFCEDIDKALTGERNITMDQILNIMDGIDSKRHEILTIFTTNDINKIHQAAIRPGRLDAVIHVERPDAAAAERLVRLYAGKNLAAKTDLATVGEALSGQIPAVIMECVQRAKRYAISLGHDVHHLTADAILASVETMKMQLDLLAEKRDATPNDLAILGTFIGKQLGASLWHGAVGIALDPAQDQLLSSAMSTIAKLREATQPQLEEGGN